MFFIDYVFYRDYYRLSFYRLHRPERKMRQNKYIKKEYKDILS